jgi:hypothetical protein
MNSYLQGIKYTRKKSLELDFYNPLAPFFKGEFFLPPKGGLFLFPLKKGGQGVVLSQQKLADTP